MADNRENPKLVSWVSEKYRTDHKTRYQWVQKEGAPWRFYNQIGAISQQLERNPKRCFATLRPYVGRAFGAGLPPFRGWIRTLLTGGSTYVSAMCNFGAKELQFRRSMSSRGLPPLSKLMSTGCVPDNQVAFDGVTG